MPSREESVFDAVLEAALDSLRLSASERAASAKRLKAMESELVTLLADFNTTDAKAARVAAFLVNIDKVIGKNYKGLAKQLDLPGIAEVSAAHISEALVIALGIETLELPSNQYLASVASDVLIQGAPSADWWNGQSVDLKNKFAQQLRLGMGAGETNQQIITRIVGNSTQPGIMETARRNADALVTTSVQTVANDARRKTFEANDDVIKGLRQVSTLDGHTSVICVAYSGAEWDLNKKPINGNTLAYGNGCPRHWRCRSLDVPIMKTFKELGLNIPEPVSSTRASSEGQISEKTTFNDFLERKGKAYQDRILGVGRADLWRDGKITLRDLVDGTGNELTLEQLRAKVARRKA